MTTNRVLLVVLSFLLLSVPAAADVVVFDNFPIDGTITGWTINFGFSVSDSFTLSSGATVTGVNFGAWLDHGDAVTGVDWAIGTTPYGSEVGSGTASVTSGLAGPPDYLGANPNGYAYDIAVASFTFPGIGLAAGTYYLTLQNAVAQSGNPVYWDENDGPGIDAWESAYGQISNNPECIGTGTCAEAFQILGVGSSDIPEPTSCILLGSGLLAVTAMRRKLVRR